MENNWNPISTSRYPMPCPTLGLYENEDYYSSRARAFSINSLVSQRLNGQYSAFPNAFSGHTDSFFGTGKIIKLCYLYIFIECLCSQLQNLLSLALDRARLFLSIPSLLLICLAFTSLITTSSTDDSLGEILSKKLLNY